MRDTTRAGTRGGREGTIRCAGALGRLPEGLGTDGRLDEEEPDDEDFEPPPEEEGRLLLPPPPEERPPPPPPPPPLARATEGIAKKATNKRTTKLRT